MRKLAAKVLAWSILWIFGLGLTNIVLNVASANNTTTNQWFTADSSAASNFGIATWESKWGLLWVVKWFVNRALGLLSLVTLIVVIYWGYQMVTAAGDEGKYKAGFKILKQAGAGLIIIWLSWIIISFIFSLFGTWGTITGN